MSETGAEVNNEIKGVVSVDGHPGRVVNFAVLREALATKGTEIFIEDDNGDIYRIHRPDPNVKSYSIMSAMQNADKGKAAEGVFLTKSELESTLQTRRTFSYGKDSEGKKRQTGKIVNITIAKMDNDFPGKVDAGHPASIVRRQFFNVTGLSGSVKPVSVPMPIAA